jgi:hypothetical protein
MPYENRLLDCEEALEGRFLEMMDEAYDNGWNAAEVAVALTNLADNLILKLMANEETVRKMVDIKFKPH